MFQEHSFVDLSVTDNVGFAISQNGKDVLEQFVHDSNEANLFLLVLQLPVVVIMYRSVERLAILVLLDTLSREPACRRRYRVWTCVPGPP